MEKIDFTVLYENKNITSDISKYMLSITYNDKQEGESDEIDIELEDKDLLWQNSWYPEKGAKLKVTMQGINCGVFEIDEIELKGSPDTVSIRGMATGIKNTLRTKKSDAHESKTLRQIVEKVAQKNNLKVVGNIPNITIQRVTQSRETDLSFLKRISNDYGVIFSVREQTITFTSIYDLQQRKESLTIDKSDLKSYSIKDKSAEGKSATKVVHSSPKKNEKIEVDLAYQQYLKDEGSKYPDIVNKDTEVVHKRTENKQQGELKAKAYMNLSASNQFEGRLSMEGNNLMISGNNFQLTGLGILSGKYNIKTSSHKIDKSGGYNVEVEIKRINTIDKSKHLTTKKVNVKPRNVKVSSANLDVYFGKKIIKENGIYILER
jgi:uncharacterized protein